MFIPVILFLASATFAVPTGLPESEPQILKIEPESLEVYLEDYFSDAPILADIAWCESRVRHFGKDGEILRGEVDSDDIGVMQINTRYHQETADELNIDIYSLHGNLEYAEHLYGKQGTKPWNASRKCWDRYARY